MSFLNILQTYPILLFSTTAVLGLLVGSFLNVVIYRLPIMMEREWKLQYQEISENTAVETDKPFNLVVPRSACPHCNHLVTALQNIPIISYILLRGKCANCKKSISMQYPLTELLTAILSIIIVYHFGLSTYTLALLFLTWALIALSIIDLKHMLLPDSITLPFIWAGLLFSVIGITPVSPQDSIMGAIIGYMILWSVFHAFKLATGKEGMGYGDFKLLALLGAWLGWQSLATIIILSSLVGTIIGISMIVFLKHDKRIPIPFGPYLAIAGWIYIIWGNQISSAYLQWMSA